MSRIAILAALPGELKPLTKDWRYERSGTIHLWRSSFGETEVIAACAGAGQPCATRAFAAAERSGAIDCVVSYGWVGALSDEFEPGKAYFCSGVIDARTGERFTAEEWASHPSRKNSFFFNAARSGRPLLDNATKTDDGAGEPENYWLVTSSRVADEAEKQRLASAYSAALVDMEAAAVARLAAMRQIPFHCIKGVSDGFRDRLPDFNRFLGADGQMRMGKLIVYALIHPGCWPALIRMGENSKRAAQAMADAARALLAELRPTDKD